MAQTICHLIGGGTNRADGADSIEVLVSSDMHVVAAGDLHRATGRGGGGGVIDAGGASGEGGGASDGEGDHINKLLYAAARRRAQEPGSGTTAVQYHGSRTTDTAIELRA